MDNFEQITTTLQNGGIAVVRTDTIYGIIALAANEAAVQKVFDAKHRDRSKQCIVLIADAQDVSAHEKTIAAYSAIDQPPTSVIVPSSNEPSWLLRGGATIAYRVVREPFLKKVVEAVGPVIAPSANPEGLVPAQTIAEAKEYFGEQVDCYIDGGTVPADITASRIIEVAQDGSVSVVRA